jgi:hypothetical protein
MSMGSNVVSNREILERIARQGSRGTSETAIVASPGARAAEWAIKVKSHSSYNVYNVIAVVIGDAGSVPTEIGQQMEAVNLAEPFEQTGALQSETYAVMFRVGNKNVFYVPV